MYPKFWLTRFQDNKFQIYVSNGYISTNFLYTCIKFELNCSINGYLFVFVFIEILVFRWSWWTQCLIFINQWPKNDKQCQNQHIANRKILLYKPIPEVDPVLLVIDACLGNTTSLSVDASLDECLGNIASRSVDASLDDFWLSLWLEEDWGDNSKKYEKL